MTTLAIIKDCMAEKSELHKQFQTVLDRVEKPKARVKDEFALPTDEEFEKYKRRLLMFKATVDPWQKQARRAAVKGH